MDKNNALKKLYLFNKYKELQNRDISYKNNGLQNIKDSYKKLYEYDRNIPDEYLRKLEKYQELHNKKFNFHSVKKNLIKCPLLVSGIEDFSIDFDYKLKYMKLITLDILINKSFSFKCLKSSNIYRTNKCFHYVIANNTKISGVEFDDLIIYVFDEIPEPFFVAIGNGSNWGVLDNYIHFIYYYKNDLIFNLHYRNEHHLNNKKKLCELILQHYTENYQSEDTTSETDSSESEPIPKKITCVFGYSINIGHTFWNEISGLNFLIDMDILKYIDNFIIGPYDYYNIHDYLIKNNYPNIIKEDDICKINNQLNNNLLVKYNDWYMSDNMKKFVIDNNKFTDIDELNKIKKVKQNFYPIITFNLRGVYRYLHNQEESLANIINNLLIIYPKLYIIFDGYITNSNVNLNFYANEGVKSDSNTFDKSYQTILNKIVSKINTTNYTSLIGTSLSRELAWLDISHYGLMQLGAGSFNYTWVMNKKALYIGRNTFINEELLLHIFHDFYYRENRDYTTYINPKLGDFTLYEKPNKEYAINWKLILLYMIRDINILEKHNYELTQYENILNYNHYMSWGLDVININTMMNNNVRTNYNMIKDSIEITKRQCYCCNQINFNKIFDLNLTLIDSIKLNNKLSVNYCNSCYFYFTESNNTQFEYNNYYQNYNKYNIQYSNASIDKDDKCVTYLLNSFQNIDFIKSILDYGCGDGLISQKLKNKYNVDTYDIGMEIKTKKYDCITICHVLEHIYDLDVFIKNIINNLSENGIVYIEVPNAEYYSEFQSFGPLQEINLEHINFFTKYALSKIMINYNFIPLKVEDDYFTINNKKYYVIRGLFQIKNNNNSFKNYIKNGSNIIENIKFSEDFCDIYVYGCGQYLFKIFNKIKEKFNIINIIDDNPNYLHQTINNIKIINFDEFKLKIGNKKCNILIATQNYSICIIEKLKEINHILIKLI
jgi:2-polyprenyl-3-methyl-5-hydroxy-6-metoxy-1,4-benzoquinol methylase